MHDPLTYYLVLLTAYYRSPADSVLCGLALALGAKPRRRCIASDAATSVKTPPALHATTAATLCCSSQRVCPGRRKEPVTALRARLLPEPEAPTTAATRHAPRFCSSTSSRGMTYCVGQARRESTLLVSSLELEPQNQLALQTARQPLICATAEHLDPSASHVPPEPVWRYQESACHTCCSRPVTLQASTVARSIVTLDVIVVVLTLELASAFSTVLPMTVAP